MNRNSDQPFRSRAEREREIALQEKYRRLGNPQVQAAAMLLMPQHQQGDARPERTPQQS